MKKDPLQQRFFFIPHSFINILIFAFCLSLLFYGAIHFFASKQKISPQVNSFTAPTPSPTVNSAKLEAERYQFPLYPDAFFYKKELTPPCLEQNDYSECGVVAYRWYVKDPYVLVKEWYTKNRVDNYEWTLLETEKSLENYTKRNIQRKETASIYSLTISEIQPTGNMVAGTIISFLLPFPSLSDTNTWEVYTNLSNKFTLKYPQNLYIIPETNTFAITDKPNPEHTIVVSEDSRYYQISVNVKPIEKETLEEIAARFDKAHNPGYTKSPYTLSGITGYRFNNIGMDSHTDIVYVVKEEKLYSISHRRFHPNLTAGSQVYEKLLSTFTFID